MPPRVGGARGATGPNGCTDPWGHVANGPAPAPYGRELVSPQSLGPNGGPGRTVRPTGGRPSTIHHRLHSLPTMFLNMPVRKLSKRSFPKGVAESAAPGLGSIGPRGVLGPMASCQGSAGLANPCGEYGPEDHLTSGPWGPGPSKSWTQTSGPWGPGPSKSWTQTQCITSGCGLCCHRSRRASGALRVLRAQAFSLSSRAQRTSRDA